MKKYFWPIAQIGYPLDRFIAQKFGNVWISDRDQVINGIQIRKGDNVYLKCFGLKGHNGIDIAAPRNTEIRAVTDGFIIEQTDKPTGFGLRISQLTERQVDGKNHVINYGHMWRFANSQEITWNFGYRGYFVKEGDIIGFVDSTGFSTGDHLHLSLYEYDLYGNKLNANNGYGGAIDIGKYMKVRLPKWAGYRNHPEKDTILRWPDMDTYNAVMAGELKLTDVFQFEEIPYTLPLDKPNFPI